MRLSQSNVPWMEKIGLGIILTGGTGMECISTDLGFELEIIGEILDHICSVNHN